MDRSRVIVRNGWMAGSGVKDGWMGGWVNLGIGMDGSRVRDGGWMNGWMDLGLKMDGWINMFHPYCHEVRKVQKGSKSSVNIVLVI